jgi:hypothetical protein
VDDDGTMIPKYPLEGGERDKAREAIDVRKTFDFCHADIVTEFRSIAISVFSGYFQGIRARENENHPLNSAKNLFEFVLALVVEERRNTSPTVVLVPQISK